VLPGRDFGPVMDCTVLGMTLDVGENDVLVTAQPLSAFIVVKALDEDGDICYCTAATEGLQSVECLGMAEYAALKLRTGMASRMNGEED
jgi:hypothetical protein